MWFDPRWSFAHRARRGVLPGTVGMHSAEHVALSTSRDQSRVRRGDSRFGAASARPRARRQRVSRRDRRRRHARSASSRSTPSATSTGRRVPRRTNTRCGTGVADEGRRAHERHHAARRRRARSISTRRCSAISPTWTGPNKETVTIRHLLDAHVRACRRSRRTTRSRTTPTASRS